MNALQDVKEAWGGLDNGEVIMSGFEYNRLGGLESSPGDTMADRSVRWLLDWLEKQPGTGVIHDPQPYERSHRAAWPDIAGPADRRSDR